MKIIRCLLRHRFVSLNICENEIPACRFRGSRIWNTIYELCNQIMLNPSEIDIVKPGKCKDFIKLEKYKRKKDDRNYDLRYMRKV